MYLTDWTAVGARHQLHTEGMKPQRQFSLPFGLVAIESMACQTPVVASDVGGLKFTVVPEITGLLVPPKDEAAFAQAIDRILSNPAWAKQLGQTDRQRVEIAFSWNSVASGLSHLYAKLLSQAAMRAVEKSQIAA